MFTITGTIVGHPATVTWDNGVLSGDEIAVRMLGQYCMMYEGRRLGPIEGPYNSENHIANPNSVAILASRLFDEGYVYTGERYVSPEREAGEKAMRGGSGV